MAEVTRADAQALINDQNTSEIWQEAAKSSTALKTFRTVSMSSKKMKMRLLDAFPATPGAGAFVTGDTGRKPTLDMAWANKYLEAEEIAGIIPIPENVLDDAEADLWGEIRPRIAEYVGKALDAAVFLGTNAPASWPDSLHEGAVAAGNTLDLSTYLAGGTQAQGFDRGGAYLELLGLVEDDGFDPNIVYVRPAEVRKLRNLRDGNGLPIYQDGIRGSDSGPSLWGVPLEKVSNTSLASGDPIAIVGDRSKAILGLREDISFKLLDQATLTADVSVRNAAGDGTTTVNQVVYSLAEQDMVALRFKMRVAFQVADPTTLEGGSSAYPFASLVA